MNNKPTLCWTCKNAVPNFKKKIGCSWSIALEPVAGWEAEQHCVDGATSYRVDSCPYYICDKKDYNKGKELKEYHLTKSVGGDFVTLNDFYDELGLPHMTNSCMRYVRIL